MSQKKEIPQAIIDDIEHIFVHTFRKIDDPSQGPMSGIGTMSDYGRFIMEVDALIDEKYPDIDLPMDVWESIKKKGKQSQRERIDIPALLKKLCEQIVDDLEKNGGKPSAHAKRDGYLIHHSPTGGLLATGNPIPARDEFDVTIHPYQKDALELNLSKRKVANIASGETTELHVQTCTFRKCTKKFYSKRMLCANCDE